MPTIWFKNIFIVAFFAVQLFMALPGFLYNQYEERGRFSWNMYSFLYHCKIRYELVISEGERTTINHREFLNNRTRSFEFLHRDDLPKFNAFVCDATLPRNNVEAIHASVACRLNHRPAVQFITRGVDICAAPNYGVVAP